MKQLNLFQINEQHITKIYIELNSSEKFNKSQITNIISQLNINMKCDIIISGCRYCYNLNLVRQKLQELLSLLKQFTNNIRIIEGGAQGIDSCAKQVAEILDLKCLEIKANWNKYRKSAGPIRNEEMAKLASSNNGFLLAFWDGSSRGTKNMINTAQRYNLNIIIVKLDL